MRPPYARSARLVRLTTDATDTPRSPRSARAGTRPARRRLPRRHRDDGDAGHRRRHAADDDDRHERPAGPELTGDPTAGKAVFTSAGCVGCHTLADAGATGNVGPNLDEAKPDSELVVTRVTKGMGAMPAVRRPAHRSADRGRGCVRRRRPPAADPSHLLSRATSRRSPATSTARSSAVTACCGRAPARRSPARRRPGSPSSSRRAGCFAPCGPISSEAGISDLVVCYQGAAVVDPVSGTFVLHEPIPLETAREAIATLTSLGHSPNCYVDDRLYVAEHTEYSRMYAGFQHIPVEEVGDLAAWLDAAADEARRGRRPGRDPGAPRGARLGVRRSPLPDDLPPLSPRARQPRGVEGNGHRVRRPASSASRSSASSRSATARTTSS